MELMLEAGEELKTKMLAESFDKARTGASEKIGERLLQLSEEDLMSVARDLDPNVLPRLFLYLDPPKIAHLLGNLKRTDFAKFEQTVTVISKMPDAAPLEQYDEDILVALDASIDQTKADAQRPFLKVYQDIVEASDDDIGETIMKELSRTRAWTATSGSTSSI